MTWDYAAEANGLPHEVQDANSGYVNAVMTATVATDDSGGPVQYYFECTTTSGFSSGVWIDTNTYSVLIGRAGQDQRFRVKARDQYGNETAWSPEIKMLPLGSY